MATLRKMLASDVLPVAPVRPIPGCEERRRPDEVEESGEGVERGRESALEGGRRTGTGRPDGAQTRTGGVAGPITGTVSTPTGSPSAGFLAQSIHQEAVGTGLHIEPWDQALEAYRRVLSGPPSGSLVKRVSV